MFKNIALSTVAAATLATAGSATTLLTTQTRSISFADLDVAAISSQQSNFSSFNSFGLTGRRLIGVTLDAEYNINGRVDATNNATGGTAASRRRDITAAYELTASSTGMGFSIGGSSSAAQTLTGVPGQGAVRTLNQLNPSFLDAETQTSNLAAFLAGPVRIFTSASALFTPTPVANVTFGAPSITGGRVLYTLTYLSIVPEPASWAMLIAGFGLVGAAARRRKAAATAA